MPYFHNFPVTFYSFNGVDYSIVIDVIKRMKIRDLFLNDSYVYYNYSVKDSDTPEIIAEKYYGSQYYFWMIFLANQINDYNYDWVMDEDKFRRYLKAKYGSYTLTLNTSTIFDSTQLNTPDPVFASLGYVKTTDFVNTYNPTASLYVFGFDNLVTTNSVRKVKVIPAGGVILEEGTYFSYGGGHQVSKIEENDNYDWYTFLSSYNHHYVDLDGNITTNDNQSATGVSFLDYETDENDKKRTIKIIDKRYLAQIEQEFKAIMGI